VEARLGRRRSGALAMKRLRKLFLWLAALTGLYFAVNAYERYYGCYDKLIVTAPGPGDMDAKAFQNICVSDFIELTDRTINSRQIVFSYEYGDDEHIDLKWIDPTHLNVTIPEVYGVELKTVFWNGVTITYHYEEHKS
jgi:hypothetical protein